METSFVTDELIFKSTTVTVYPKLNELYQLFRIFFRIGQGIGQLSYFSFAWLVWHDVPAK